MEKKSRKKKATSIGSVIRGMIFVVALCVFCYSAFQLYQIFSNYKKSIDEYNDIKEQVQHTVGEEEEEQEFPSEIYINGVSLSELLGKRYEFDFDKLLKINSEVVGWISIKDTTIDYPMVQTTDNEKYLRQTLTGEFNNAGTIFVDTNVINPFEDRNTVIHGHNQRSKQMFHDLIYYDDISFYQEHPVVVIYTPTETMVYEVFSAYSHRSELTPYKLGFANDSQYESWLQEIKEKPVIDTGVEVGAKDKIITLSTCTNDWEDERFVVHARRVY